ncbi:hypothetical protein SynNOUM97013_00813 [Synechococcus sp. NOUM97013]|nr:hypothetical protein SynNOUM97013_00813 [Synechococcus sp. NOUM97013]
MVKCPSQDTAAKPIAAKAVNESIGINDQELWSGLGHGIGDVAATTKALP